MSARTYRVTVRGQLSQRFGELFDGLTLVSGDRETAIVGELRDQSQLHGLLDRVHGLGLELVSVREVEPEEGHS